jgi:lysophospholipase L1-like esterase
MHLLYLDLTLLTKLRSVGKAIRSYVALGDSLSEGLGDFSFDERRVHSGWTDRFATLLAREAELQGHEFHYANLAIRGAKIADIMGHQLNRALLLKPDLVTVMAGQNDLLSKAENYPLLEQQLRDGIQKLLDAGCQVIVSNTINPIHLMVFRPLSRLAVAMTEMIERVAKDMNVPIHDVHRIQSLADVSYWAEDMVHFSGPGHIKVANEAAVLLDLRYRLSELDDCEIAVPARGLYGTTRWLLKHVVPFFWRRIRRVSSGDGLEPKLPELTPYSGLALDLEPAEEFLPANFGKFEYSRAS